MFTSKLTIDKKTRKHEKTREEYIFMLVQQYEQQSSEKSEEDICKIH